MDKTYVCGDSVPGIAAGVIFLPVMIAVAIAVDDISLRLGFAFLAVVSAYLLYSSVYSITIFDSEGFRFLLSREVYSWKSITDAVMCTEYRRTRHGRRKVIYLAVFTDKYRYNPKKKGVPKKEKAITMGGVLSREMFEKYLRGYRPDLAIRYPYEGEYYEA